MVRRNRQEASGEKEPTPEFQICLVGENIPKHFVLLGESKCQDKKAGEELC